MNLSGRHITEWILKRLRERGEVIPPEESFEVAKHVKENYCYVGNGVDGSNAAPISTVVNSTHHFSIKEERYLAAECFFNPSIIRGQQLQQLHSLPNLVDAAINAAPLDLRRALLENIVLAGGSTMFKNFGRRLEREVQSVVSKRLKDNSAKLHLPSSTSSNVKVKVVSHAFQKDAAWCGGSIIAESAQFQHLLVTKADYLEHGSAAVRKKILINTQM
jgi:actin-related protein 3